MSFEKRTCSWKDHHPEGTQFPLPCAVGAHFLPPASRGQPSSVFWDSFGSSGFLQVDQRACAPGPVSFHATPRSGDIPRWLRVRGSFPSSPHCRDAVHCKWLSSWWTSGQIPGLSYEPSAMYAWLRTGFSGLWVDSPSRRKYLVVGLLGSLGSVVLNCLRT